MKYSLFKNINLFYKYAAEDDKEELIFEEINPEYESQPVPIPSIEEISSISETSFPRGKEKIKHRKTTKQVGAKPLTKKEIESKFKKGSSKGRSNILSVYLDASPEEKDYWGNWYFHAQQDVMKLAQHYNIPFEQAAAIVAVLSPGNKWKDNLLAAARILSRSEKVNAYPANIRKAIQIKNADSDFESYVTGPKVSVFLQSLLKPESIKDQLVLDGHAINIWFGQKVMLKLVPDINQLLRKTIVEDYKRVASELGISPMALQATTWYVWKYLAFDVEPPATEMPNPDTKS